MAMGKKIDDQTWTTSGLHLQTSSIHILLFFLKPFDTIISKLLHAFVSDFKLPSNSYSSMGSWSLTAGVDTQINGPFMRNFNVESNVNVNLTNRMGLSVEWLQSQRLTI